MPCEIDKSTILLGQQVGYPNNIVDDAFNSGEFLPIWQSMGPIYERNFYMCNTDAST